MSILAEDTSDITCSICTEMLDNPIVIKECEHYFCSSCLMDWIATQKHEGKELTCPDCRGPLSDADLNKRPRLMRSVLSRYQLKCSNETCEVVSDYDGYNTHKDTCPVGIVSCEHCNVTVMRNQQISHQDCD